MSHPDRSSIGHSFPDDPDLRRFADELGMLWNCVAPLVRPRNDSESNTLHELMHSATRQCVYAGASVSAVASYARELDALRAGWSHFSPGQKAVLNAAAAYVLSAADPPAELGVAMHVPAQPLTATTSHPRPTEVDQAADLVVTAAVRTLLHRS